MEISVESFFEICRDTQAGELKFDYRQIRFLYDGNENIYLHSEDSML